jgi:hypothetical protein
MAQDWTINFSGRPAYVRWLQCFASRFNGAMGKTLLGNHRLMQGDHSGAGRPEKIGRDRDGDRAR